MGSPAHPRPVSRLSIPAVPSTFSGSSVATPLATPSASAIPYAAITRRPSVAPLATPKQAEEGNAPPAPQRPPLLGNTSTDPPPRNPSPESAYSQQSMRSASANVDMGDQSPFSDGYLTPYFSYSSDGSLQPFHSVQASQSSLSRYPRTPFSTPVSTPGNASVQPRKPSVHFAVDHTPPDVPVDIASREPSPYAFRAPPASYMRPGGDDPRWRAGGAPPRANGGWTGMPYQADPRRYWGMPGTQPGRPFVGAGYGAPGPRYFAGPPQPGLGYARPAMQRAPTMPMYPARMTTTRMTNGVGGARDAAWREMVMRAASS
uniref:N/A n=1 Tax=Ganoderma boninense TaxID=34458 RepID=A0A5K1JXY0_9APHY|nr:N/A [Ganoderma boninense]